MMMGCTCGRCTDWPPMTTPPGWEYLLHAWACPSCVLLYWTPYVGEPLIEVRVDGDLPAGTFDSVKALTHPDGTYRVRMVIRAGRKYPNGPRADGYTRLTLGPEYRADHRQLVLLSEFGEAEMALA